ncbi:MAG: acyltransferase [Bacteroidota bacterium]|nr:acyltransferase [Bacteroidota bacterium]
MRSILKWLLNKSGVGSSNRFNAEWDGMSVLRVFLMLSVCAIRGLLRIPFLGSAKGILLIGKGVIIRHAKHLHVGKSFIAEDYCEIQSISRRGIVFGNRVTVGRFAIIRPTNFYGGELGEGLKVGNNSNIGPYNYIGCSGYIEIGNNVLISPRVSIYAENHAFSEADVVMKEQGVERSTVIIEDDCWIAANSIILSGVRVGRGSIVAAGSVVSKDVPPYSVVAGVPAKIIRSRKNETNNETK